MMKEETKKRIKKFVDDREWNQFHTPENLAKSIAIEASELLECFQWDNENFDLEHVKEELADVLIYCEDLLNALRLDEDKIINDKIDKNEQKYPVSKAKGNAKKYNQF